MHRLSRLAAQLGIITASACACFGAQAQTTATTGNATADSYSWIPFTSYGYFGTSVGRSDYDLPCYAGYACDNKDTAFKIYTGGQLYKIIGLELAYINMGTAERGGGVNKAQGVNLSLVANAPIGNVFSVFGKVGTTYGWTKQSAVAPGAASGDEDGFGLSYGAGLSFDLDRRLQMVLEWERHRLNYVERDDDVNLYTVGLKYKF